METKKSIDSLLLKSLIMKRLLEICKMVLRKLIGKTPKR